MFNFQLLNYIDIMTFFPEILGCEPCLRYHTTYLTYRHILKTQGHSFHKAKNTFQYPNQNSVMYSQIHSY